MKQIILKTLQFGLMASSVFAPTAALSAGSDYSEYVSKITLERQGIQIDVVLENISNNKHINFANIQPKTSSFDVDFRGVVICQKNKRVDYITSKVYLGNVSLFVDTINEQGAHLLGDYKPSFEEWSGTKWFGEAGNFDPVTFNINQLKNLSQDIRIDPLAEFNKKLNAHINGGKSKLDFLQNEQFFSINRPITLASACRKYLEPGNHQRKWGYKTINVNFSFRYAGDPEIHNKAQVKAGLIGGQSEINQNLPLKLNEAKFQPNMPHHIGKCAPDTDPVIRVNYKGNGKGKIRFMVEDNGSPVFSTNEISYDSKQQLNQHLDFEYPLIAKLAQRADWRQINKTINHPLQVKAKVKDVNANSWSDWEDFGSATWRHRCTPQLAIPSANNGQKAFDQSPQSTDLGKIRKQVTPTPKPARQSNN